MSHYDFFQNSLCEYFPCHPTDDRENFSCLFCYCPLYALGKDCGGNFIYTHNGIKDCSACLVPHKRENYGYMCKKLGQVIEMVREKDTVQEEP